MLKHNSKSFFREIFRNSSAVDNDQIETIYADGKCLLPAGIDACCTMLLPNDPSSTMLQLADATKAAVSGGTGTVGLV